VTAARRGGGAGGGAAAWTRRGRREPQAGSPAAGAARAGRGGPPLGDRAAGHRQHAHVEDQHAQETAARGGKRLSADQRLLSILLLKPQVSVTEAVSGTGWRCTESRPELETVSNNQCGLDWGLSSLDYQHNTIHTAKPQ